MRKAAFIIGGIVIAAAAIIALWDWNWFRPLVEREASKALGRQVRIAHFDILHALSRSPDIVATGIAIANPPDFPKESRFGTIDRLDVRIDARTALESRGRDLVLEDITIEHPKGDLGPGPKGDPNWNFRMPQSSGSGGSVKIGTLNIVDGTVHIVDPALKSDFTVAIHTDKPGTDGEGRIVAQARGTYSGQPITADFTGGSLLSLRDPSKPYPVDFRAANGPTHIRLNGTIQDPVQLAGADLRLDLAGKDMADLYQLIGIPLAPTPAYHLTGRIDYAKPRIRFEDFAGTVGRSDLEGNFEVEPGKARPLITANLASHRIVLADLAGFIGSAPGRPDDPNQSATQKAEHAERAASPNLLPDTPISLPKIRAADFRVHYKGDHIDNPSVPLDNLETDLTIENGAITLHPLKFGVGTGSILANIALNAQSNLVHAKADVDFRQVDLRRILQSTHIFEGAGVIGGRADIDGTGNSLAQLLGRGNGNLALFMNGGDISALLVDLAGLDFGNSMIALLGLPSHTKIRCMVSDFGLQQGMLQTRTLLFDTEEANIIGKGTVNLRNETVDYQITQQPKHFSIGAFHAPIDIDGPLENPSVLPDPKVLAARTSAAVVLGIFLTPLGALLPTIQLGLGKDNDCNQLVATVKEAAQAAQRESRSSP